MHDECHKSLIIPSVVLNQLTDISKFTNYQITSMMPVMGHLVLGFPSLPESINTARQYVAAGISILELQIPFSHPTADGPVITMACQEATEVQKVTVQDCMDAIATLRAEFPEQEIMVMSYLNRIYSYGFQRLIDTLKTLHIRHLIVPDLPVDSALATSYFGTNSAVRLVPVVAANIPDARLDKLNQAGFNFYYLMSDFKITGSGFSLNPRLEEVISSIRKHSAAAGRTVRTGIGFGISTREQATLVCQTADFAIIGSALITAKKEGKLEEYLEELTIDN
jgi:tryptophan synthase alpha chain